MAALYCCMHCSLLQVVTLVAQSVIIGYLSDYFSASDPSAEDDRDAYLLAFGKLVFNTSCLCYPLLTVLLTFVIALCQVWFSVHCSLWFSMLISTSLATRLV